MSKLPSSLHARKTLQNETRRRWRANNKDRHGYLYIGKNNFIKWEATRKELNKSQEEFVSLLLESYDKQRGYIVNSNSRPDDPVQLRFGDDSTVILKATIALESWMKCFLSVYNGTIENTNVNCGINVMYEVKEASKGRNVHRQQVNACRVKRKNNVRKETPGRSDLTDISARERSNEPDQILVQVEEYGLTDRTDIMVGCEKEESQATSNSVLEENEQIRLKVCDTISKPLRPRKKFNFPLDNVSNEQENGNGSDSDQIEISTDNEQDSNEHLTAKKTDEANSSDGNSFNEEDEGSNNDNGSDVVEFTTSRSSRPQRNVKRRVYRKRDLYSSDDEDESSCPTKKRRAVRCNKTKATARNKPDDPAWAINGSDEGTEDSSSDSDYFPSDASQEKSSSLEEESEEEDSSPDSNDEGLEDEQIVSSKHKHPMKSVSEERENIIENRKIYSSESVENGTCDRLDPSVSVTETDNCENGDTDSSENSEDLYRSYAERLLGKQKKEHVGSLGAYKPFKHYAKYSSVIRNYTFSGHREGHVLICYICGYRSVGSYLLMHIVSMHHQSTSFVEERVHSAMSRATRLPALPLIVQPPLAKGELLCLMCRKIITFKKYAKHVKTEHRNPITLKSFLYNYGVDSFLLSALNRNVLQFDYLSGLFVCNICAIYGLETLINKVNATRHIMAHDELATQCELCQTKQKDLAAHILQTHPDLALRCELCVFVTTEKSILEEHIHVRHPYDLCCTESDCTANFTSEGALRRHIIAEHLETEEPNTNRHSLKRIGRKDEGLFGPSESASRVEVSISCQYCDKKISGVLHRINFKVGEHVENDHQDVLKNLPKEVKFVCKSCNMIFWYREGLRKHKVFCKGPKKCYIDDCPMTFSSLKILSGHMFANHRQSAECPICKQRFASGKELKRHRNKMHRQANIICVACGKGFKRLDHLRVHELIHTGEKPLKCDYCDFTGRQRNNISSHVKVHHKDKLQEYMKRNT